MSKTVPFQTSPNQQLSAGSEVQLAAGPSVKVSGDTASGQIAAQGKAMTALGTAMSKIDDELNDAEAKNLFNTAYYDVERIQDEYLGLKGKDAVATLTTEGDGQKKKTVLDEYNNNKLQGVVNSYSEQASSGIVKYMYEKMISTSVRSAQNNMIEHSLKQQRKYKLDELSNGIEINTRNAKAYYKDWNNPIGKFNNHRRAGEELLLEKAALEGWNVDPNAIGPDGKLLGISKQYLNEKSKYNFELAQAVLDAYEQDEDTAGAKAFKLSLNPDGNFNYVDEKTINKLGTKLEKNHTKIISNHKVNAVLASDGNQNNGDFLTQVSVLNGLSSNQSFDDGKGAVVTDGLHSDEIDITDKKQTEKTEMLQRMRDSSMFYETGSSKEGSLLLQHQPIHLFAIQRLGAKKADSLYLKAEKEYQSSIPIPKNKRRNRKEYVNNYLKNPENILDINKGVLKKYNELIVDAVGNKFSKYYRATKTIFPNPPKRSDFQTNTRSGINAYTKALKAYKDNKDNAIQVNPGVANEDFEAMTGKAPYGGKTGFKAFEKEKLEKQRNYLNKIINDLEVITNNVDYGYMPLDEQERTINLKTGLQPKEVIAKKLKATTLNKEELANELKTLDIEYEKIASEREAIYDANFSKATEISYAKPGGHNELSQYEIDIENFTPEDQEKLKNGPPEESDIETLAKLDNDPEEVRDNLDQYRWKLSEPNYLRLKQESEEFKKSSEKYKEASGDVSLLKDVMYKSGYNWVYGDLKGNNAAKFHGIKVAWINRIDEVQRKEGNVKLGRVEKERLLRNVLLDKVNLPKFFGGKKDVYYSSVTEDQLDKVFVLVDGERISGSDIDKDVKTEIKRQLYLLKTPMNEQQIAERWVKFGKPKTYDEFKSIVKNLTN